MSTPILNFAILKTHPVAKEATETNVGDERESRNIGLAAGFAPVTEEEDNYLAYPYAYDVNAHDLLAVESQSPDNEVNSEFPYTYEQPGFEDKVFSTIGNLFGNGDGTATGTGTGTGAESIFGAILPAAIFGLVAVAASTLFVNQVNVNATSKEDTPFLFKLPTLDGEGGGLFGLGGNDEDDKRRKRRDVEDNSIFPNSFDDFAIRLQDGLTLYALMNGDKECREKIACIFGTQTRRSQYKDRIVALMRHFMPNRLKDFTHHFMAATERTEEDNQVGRNSLCDQMNCKKCFGV